jgi:hypothetical protein
VLGRSRGRRSTKINAHTNGEGLPIGLVITRGQAHDVTAFHCDPEQLLGTHCDSGWICSNRYAE